MNRKLIAYVLLLFTFASITIAQKQDLDNRFRLGKNYEQAGQLEKAQDIYADLIAIQPWNMQYIEALNGVYVLQKNYEQSISLLEQKIKEQPKNISLYGLLGTTHFIMGDRGKAKEVWYQGINTQPNSVVSYRMIANNVLENRDFETAAEIMTEGKKIADDPRIFSYELARLYTLTMQYGKATEEYCEIIAVQPGQIQVVQSRFDRIAADEEAVQAAIDVVRRYKEEKGIPAFTQLLSHVLILAERYDEAYQVTLELEKETGNNGSRIFDFAQQAYGNKHYAIASRAYKKIIDDYSSSPFIATARIGYVKTLEAALDRKYENNNEWKPYSEPDTAGAYEYHEIVRAYNNLIENFPDGTVYLESLYRLGAVYKYKLHNREAADSLYAMAIEKAPLSQYATMANEGRADIAIMENDLTAAEEHLNKILKNPKAMHDSKRYSEYMLARIAFWQGDFETAASRFNEFTQNLASNFANDALEVSLLITALKNDSTSLASYAKADLLAEQSKFTKAEEEFLNLHNSAQHFLLKETAHIKYAEMLIAKEDFPTAIKVLEEINESEEKYVNGDKALFLLGSVYNYGVNDLNNAKLAYQKLLEKFPNSLYLEKSRQNILTIDNRLKEST